jgi:hypothetical protein
MKHCLILVLLTGTFTVSYSQMPATMRFDPNKALQVYFGLGGAYNNFENLNNTLSDASLPTVGKSAFANILEIDLRHKNLVFGINTGVGFSPKKEDDYNTFLMSIYGGLNVGYYIVNSGNFHLAPQAGIGFYVSEAKIMQKNGYEDFNDVLENGNSIDINQATPALDLCLKFDFGDFTKGGTFFPGFRVGYRYGLINKGWGIDETSNSTVDGSPKDHVNQFYVLLTIGFSGLKPLK